MTDSGLVLPDQHCRTPFVSQSALHSQNTTITVLPIYNYFCSEDGYITSSVPSANTLRHVKHDYDLIFLKVRNKSGASSVTND